MWKNYIVSILLVIVLIAFDINREKKILEKLSKKQVQFWSSEVEERLLLTQPGWATIPGLSITFSLAEESDIQITASGTQRLLQKDEEKKKYPIGQAGYRLKIDEEIRGNPVWGEWINSSNTPWDIWSFTDFTYLKKGEHTIEVQVNSADSELIICGEIEKFATAGSRKDSYAKGVLNIIAIPKPVDGPLSLLKNPAQNSILEVPDLKLPIEKLKNGDLALKVGEQFKYWRGHFPLTGIPKGVYQARTYDDQGAEKGVSYFFQDIDLANYSRQIDSSFLAFVFSASINTQNKHTGVLQMKFYNSKGFLINSLNTPEVETKDQWVNQHLTALIPRGTKIVRVYFISYVWSGGTNYVQGKDFYGTLISAN